MHNAQGIQEDPAPWYRNNQVLILKLLRLVVTVHLKAQKLLKTFLILKLQHEYLNFTSKIDLLTLF